MIKLKIMNIDIIVLKFINKEINSKYKILKEFLNEL